MLNRVWFAIAMSLILPLSLRSGGAAHSFENDFFYFDHVLERASSSVDGVEVDAKGGGECFFF